MDEGTKVKALDPTPHYHQLARQLYDQKLKEFASKKQELIEARNAFKIADEKFKSERSSVAA